MTYQLTLEYSKPILKHYGKKIVIMVHHEMRIFDLNDIDTLVDAYDDAWEDVETFYNYRLDHCFLEGSHETNVEEAIDNLKESCELLKKNKGYTDHSELYKKQIIELNKLPKHVPVFYFCYGS